MRGTIAWLLSGLLLAGCGENHPSEATLVREFEANRSAFSEVADMAAEDTAFSRIAKDFTHPNWDLAESGQVEALSEERWSQYREAFKQLGLESGVTIYDNDTIVLERSASGLVTSGSSVGFMRTNQIPEVIDLIPSSAPLECDMGREGWCHVAKHLDDNWYLVFEAH